MVAESDRMEMFIRPTKWIFTEFLILHKFQMHNLLNGGDMSPNLACKLYQQQPLGGK